MDAVAKVIGGLWETLQRDIRAQRLAQLDQRPDGSLWCPRHEVLVDPDSPTLECPGCVADAERRLEAQRRRDGLATWWPPQTLPRWPWARLGNTPWEQRANQRLLSVLRAWMPSKSMLLLGPTGSGKTSGVVARVHELGEHARRWADEVWSTRCPVCPTLYATELELVQARRRHPLGHGEPPVVAHAMAVPCLILDEVGATRDLLTHEVLDARMRRGLPTVALAGWPKAELAERVGDACYRRLEQGAILCDLHEEAHGR